MFHYHFHVYDGRETLDREGIALRDMQAAQREAMQFAGELLIHEGERLVENGGCLIIVKDDRDVTQFRLDLTVTLEALPAASAATRRG